MSNQYIVKWGNILQDNYNYGATIVFEKNGSVSYSAPLMPPSLCIKNWYSQRGFHISRNAPYLPILRPNQMYQLQVNLELAGDSAIQIKLLFFNRYDRVIEELFVSELTDIFTFPEQAVHYEIQLINKHHQQLTFHNLVITELDVYEHYEQPSNSQRELLYYPCRALESKHIQCIFLPKKNQVQHLYFTTHSDYLFCLIDPMKPVDVISLSTQIYQVLVQKNLREVEFTITKALDYYNLPSQVYAIPRIINTLLSKQAIVEPKETSGLASINQTLDEMQISIQVLQHFLLENNKGK